MKSKIIKNIQKPGALLLSIPNTGNAGALLLEWSANYVRNPIWQVYLDDGVLLINLGDNHSFYSEAMNYINSNL